MKHIQALSQERPAMAQFEPILQFIGIIQSILGTPGIVIQNVTAAIGVFGTAISVLQNWQLLQQLKAQNQGE